MSLKILIVEDEVLIAETIKLFLEERDYLVSDICISYEEALHSYQEQKPDLVILDIRLYGPKSGIDFAKFLLEQPQKTPFIYLTSQYDKRILDLALETTPYGYLAKPVQKESLWTTVATAYRRFQLVNNSSEELTVFDGQKHHRITTTEILSIKSEHVYANINLVDGRRIVIRKSLSQFLEQIHDKLLFQCHRSFIINTKHVYSWNSDTVTLINGEIVPVSRSKKQLLMELL